MERCMQRKHALLVEPETIKMNETLCKGQERTYETAGQVRAERARLGKALEQ